METIFWNPGSQFPAQTLLQDWHFVSSCQYIQIARSQWGVPNNIYIANDLLYDT